MPLNPIRITRGLETSDASAYSSINTLRKMKGAVYTQASFVVKKAKGRTLFSRAPTGGTTQSIAALDFNLISDQIYQQAGVNFYLAKAGVTGNFVAMQGQTLSPTPASTFTSLSAAHSIVTARASPPVIVSLLTGI